MANHTILLIDYEPRSIELVRKPLAALGYAVEVATDGLTGIEAFNRLAPDLVLIEAMIPKKHGFEVCQELKKTPLGKRTPILITTGVYKGRKYRTQALHIYGCDEYVEKPIAEEQLIGLVQRFLGEPPRKSTAPSESSSGAVAGIPVSAPKLAPALKRSAPAEDSRSIVGDLTEEEITARLDAILPDESTGVGAEGAQAFPLMTDADLGATGLVDLPILQNAGATPGLAKIPLESALEGRELEGQAELHEAVGVLDEVESPGAGGSKAGVSKPGRKRKATPAGPGDESHVVSFDATRSRKNRRSHDRKPGGVNNENAGTSLGAPEVALPQEIPERIVQANVVQPESIPLPQVAVYLRSEEESRPRTSEPLFERPWTISTSSIPGWLGVGVAIVVTLVIILFFFSS